MSERIEAMIRRDAMIRAELENVLNVWRQLADGYYSDSTHDETQRAGDFLIALHNEREAEMNADNPPEYGYDAFATEYGIDGI